MRISDDVRLWPQNYSYYKNNVETLLEVNFLGHPEKEFYLDKILCLVCILFIFYI